MIIHLKNKTKNYYKELTEINFKEFNLFLLKVIVKGFFKTESIIPVMVGFLLIVLSIQVESQAYIFFPQGNIPAFLTFIIFQFAMAVIILLIFPFAIILVFNYICGILQNFNSRLLLPIKVIALVLTFTLGMNQFISDEFHVHERLWIVTLWSLLYFLFVNMFLAYKQHNHPFKFTVSKVIFAAVFGGILAQPLMAVIAHTSQKINYIEINPRINLSQSSCDLIAKRPYYLIKPDNLTINHKELFESNSQGCYFYGNIVRVGFASDYVISLKENVLPVIENGKEFNYYTHLNCYSGNCFAEDGIKHEVSKDTYQKLFDAKARAESD